MEFNLVEERDLQGKRICVIQNLNNHWVPLLNHYKITFRTYSYKITIKTSNPAMDGLAQ